jgi:hypothetical protein
MSMTREQQKDEDIQRLLAAGVLIISNVVPFRWKKLY